MAVQVTVGDTVVREWARNVGLDVGSRGRLSQEIVAQFSAYAQMPLAMKVEWLTGRLEDAHRRIVELEGERSENEAIIRSYRMRVASLEGELEAMTSQRDLWRRTSIVLAGITHSTY
jgi:hypothetical protein